jgi:hypothetical protein
LGKTIALRFEIVRFLKKPALYALKTLNFKLTLPSLASRESLVSDMPARDGNVANIFTVYLTFAPFVQSREPEDDLSAGSDHQQLLSHNSLL